LPNQECLTVPDGLGDGQWRGADVHHHQAARLAGKPGSMQQAAVSRLFSLYWGFVDIMLWKVIRDLL
jgi:hypothetical protein